LTGCLHAHPVIVVTNGGGAPAHLDCSWHQHGQKVGGPLFERRSVEWHGCSNDAAGLYCLGYGWYRRRNGAAGMGWTATRVSRDRARPTYGSAVCVTWARCSVCKGAYAALDPALAQRLWDAASTLAGTFL